MFTFIEAGIVYIIQGDIEDELPYDNGSRRNFNPNKWIVIVK